MRVWYACLRWQATPLDHRFDLVCHGKADSVLAAVNDILVVRRPPRVPVPLFVRLVVVMCAHTVALHSRLRTMASALCPH